MDSYSYNLGNASEIQSQLGPIGGIYVRVTAPLELDLSIYAGRPISIDWDDGDDLRFVFAKVAGQSMTADGTYNILPTSLVPAKIFAGQRWRGIAPVGFPFLLLESTGAATDVRIRRD